MTSLISANLISYANLLLLVATLLYIAHLKFKARGVGLWAMGLSVLGACGLIASLMLKFSENQLVQRGNYVPITTLPDVLTLFCAITVIAYLIMEWTYKTRSAGAFVMPIVAAAILFQSFGYESTPLSSTRNILLLRNYWIHAHVLANLISYSAFAAAAALGVMYLWRSYRHCYQEQPEGSLLLRHNLSKIELVMVQSVKLGFILFTLGQALGIYFADQAWGKNWGWDIKDTWSIFIWIFYAFYVVMQQSFRWHGRRMAWWAIMGFNLTIIGLLVVNLFFSNLHFYG